MSNIIDYLDWRGDITLAASPFNEIDNIILSMSTFVDFTDIVSPDVASEPLGFKGAMHAFERVIDTRQYLGVLVSTAVSSTRKF